MTILSFIIALGVLVFIHELGHFLLAKRAGVRVEEFSIGFGPRLFGMTRGETDYRICLIPLGGYVKLHGQEREDEGGNDQDAFAQKSLWARAKVILCGPFMNLLLCLFLMPIVFMVGRDIPAFLSQEPILIGVEEESPADSAGLLQGDRLTHVDGAEVTTWEETLSKLMISSGSHVSITFERGSERIDHEIELPEARGEMIVGIEPPLFLGNDAVIDGVTPHGAAAEAGLQEKDRVIALNGGPIRTWNELADRINETKGEDFSLEVERSGEMKQLTLSAEFDTGLKRWLIGIQKDRQTAIPMTQKRYGLLEAIQKGTQENLKLLALTLDVLKRLLSFELSYKVLGGPISIAKTSGAAAASGFADFLYFLCFLSLQLGILNLLPIPVLDGGHLVFIIYEAIRGVPAKARVRQLANQLGFALLMTLMFVVTLNDLERVWGLGSYIKKFF